MHTTCTFVPADFTPSDWSPTIETALPTGHAHMTKTFAGGLEGRAETQFTAAYDMATGVGTYVAMESIEGVLDGRRGAFNLVHSATTDGASPESQHPFVLVVPGSGRDELAGISGTGSIRVGEDGTHHLDLDYELPGGHE
jgi:hypothetical protein